MALRTLALGNSTAAAVASIPLALWPRAGVNQRLNRFKRSNSELCFSRETLNIVENLGLTNAQKKDQAQIIAALKAHVEGRINETIECRNLLLHTKGRFAYRYVIVWCGSVTK